VTENCCFGLLSVLVILQELCKRERTKKIEAKFSVADAAVLGQ